MGTYIIFYTILHVALKQWLKTKIGCNINLSLKSSLKHGHILRYAGFPLGNTRDISSYGFLDQYNYTIRQCLGIYVTNTYKTSKNWLASFENLYEGPSSPLARPPTFSPLFSCH
jgi:hypothetical protein